MYSNCDRLFFLEQFTVGLPQELVHSCQFMEPRRGYAEAKSLLKENFGNYFMIATAYLDRALNWSAKQQGGSPKMRFVTGGVLQHHAGPAVHGGHEQYVSHENNSF